MKQGFNLKNILSILVIIAGGFVLFNVAFLLYALVINSTMSVLKITQKEAPPIIGRLLYLFIIFLISWFVFRSRLNDLIKAVFLTMPLMVTFIIMGIILYEKSKWIIIGIGAVIVFGILSFLYKKKLSWLYYFSTFYVVFLGLYVMMFNVQI